MATHGMNSSSSTNNSTNGDSARQWLAEHGQTTSAERIAQIRQNIELRLSRLPEDHEETKGLLEALDVMDSFINESVAKHNAITSNNAETSNKSSEVDVALDYSPLIPEGEPTQPQLSATEKQARFQQLLQQSQKKGAQ